ncbi:MAG TPA: SGNH/GDSL hydrolase family protein [Planctomycetota bacterium]|jgi:GDSL-like Lipase/Acylhydrolase family|nr:SGNH/GDSL hydrolase family protein [Planctomycetota bacterium]
MSARAPSTAARHRAPLWQKLLLALAAVVLDLLLLEAACRVSGAFPPDPITWPGQYENRESRVFSADRELGWRLRPGADFPWPTEGVDYRILAGAEGFRIDDSPPAAPADPAAPRVDFVGDSFTFGTGVRWSETFAEQACARLRARAVNHGMAGFGVDQMVLTLERVSLRGEAGEAGGPPALVVLTLIADDLQRSLHAYRANAGFNKPSFRVDDEVGFIERTPADRPGALLRFLDEHSHFYAATRGLLRRLGRRWPVGEWWQVNAAWLRRAFDACRQAGVPLLVVHVPQRDRCEPFRTLAQLCAEHDVAFLDVAAAWSESPRDAYWPRDGHLNAKGHALVGELVAQAITAHWPRLAR